MKAIGDEVKLKYRLEYGDPPQPDDVLRTARGRCYLVRKVTLAKSRYTLWCVVVPPDVETPGRWYTLRWDKRRRRAR